jgi:hypothetical protein
MPNAELELLPEAGHSPWLDDMDGCVTRMTRYLAGARAESAEGPAEAALAS